MIKLNFKGKPFELGESLNVGSEMVCGCRRTDFLTGSWNK